MIGGVLKKVFGTQNEREIKRILKIVELINSLEHDIQSLSDEALQAKTIEFKAQLAEGKTLEDILPEAFAVVRETSIRILGMRHYDVQLVGGVVLHEGKIAEMRTGEGKTLVATLPIYLNALTGKGVHLVTVNDYLATRDEYQMGKIYNFLGLSTDVVVANMSNEQKRAAYKADIVYGTNNEYGFDFLRDNMVTHKEDKVQRALNYAIVDEVDSILVDEARTPLIISGPAQETTKHYDEFNKIVNSLQKSVDYEVDEKANTVVATDDGIKKVESILGIDNLYSATNIELTHYLSQALKAKELFHLDKEYLIRDGEVIIVDEFTGRAMSGRRYSEGLHQAIEAKEGIEVAGENQTLATITLQNYFRMYQKLSGMTGTAETEASEFMAIYELPIVIIPTNKPIVRKDHADLIYKTEKEKYEAIIERIVQIHLTGQPILVGTASINHSEVISTLLKKRKIPHNVLNAKFHEMEADIVAQAGAKGTVTVATNMAGRGTDILLGGNPEFLAKREISEEDETYPQVLEKYKQQCKNEEQEVFALGGLFILGTERHESRRIDNQLRGRSGRQGNPGESVFFIALEDELMRIFGSDKMKGLLEKMGLKDGESISHPFISGAIENAQKKVEDRNFSIRKHLIEYDDVMNKQREVIYKERDEVLERSELTDIILKMMKRTVEREVNFRLQGEVEQWEIHSLHERIHELYMLDIASIDIEKITAEETSNQIYERLLAVFNEKKGMVDPEQFSKIERYIMLEILDARWRENLKTLDALKEGIGLRGYAQVKPIVQYKILSSEMFEGLIHTIEEEVPGFMVKLKIEKREELPTERQQTPMYFSHGGETTAEVVKQQPVRKKKVGRNDPCPCGSGEKYKNCHGKD
ncbi:MAG: preprotein translocase subunit SecA [Fusobacteria bacterium]|nr:preprotein translocase subunit SecA [Fusobacteriota bacterium]